MEMTGEQRIPAPREKVWEGLNDPEVLKASIPGCQELTRTEDGGGFDAKVKAKVGPVSATFSGTVTLSNIEAPKSYTISGEGKGGVAGFAKGGADVSLAEEGAETLLTYKVSAQVGGKLAQIGSRLIDSTAKKMAGQFFSKFSEIVAGEPPPEGEQKSGAEARQDQEGQGQQAAAAPKTEPAAEERQEAQAAAPGDAQTDAHGDALGDAHGDAHEDDHGDDHGHHPEIPPALTDEALNKDVGKGVSTGVWVTGLFVVVLILLAIFGLGGEDEPAAPDAGHGTESHSN